MPDVPGIGCRAAPIRLAYCVPIVVVGVHHARLGCELVRHVVTIGRDPQRTQPIPDGVIAVTLRRVRLPRRAHELINPAAARVQDGFRLALTELLIDQIHFTK